jgi:WD40 repeat protein
LAISPDGKRLSGSDIVFLWDSEAKEQIRRFDFYTNAIAYSPDGRTALAGLVDGSSLVTLRSGAEIGRFPPGKDPIRGVAYGPDGRARGDGRFRTLNL